jgi:hypothetical protein
LLSEDPVAEWIESEQTTLDPRPESGRRSRSAARIDMVNHQKVSCRGGTTGWAEDCGEAMSTVGAPGYPRGSYGSGTGAPHPTALGGFCSSNRIGSCPECFHLAGSYGTCCLGICHETLREITIETWLDYGDFYSCRTLALLGAGLGTAAVLANTSLDREFQDWHDEQVKSSGTDDFASAVKWLGDGRVMIPVVAGSAFLEPLGDCGDPLLAAIGQWGSRCSRSLLVGGPPMLALKYFLNASRPEDEFTSRWRPFDSPYREGAVSGHAFVGAIPFLNAAMMTDDLGWQILLYGASTLTAWSRINDRRHYLSQAMLGWWLAWLSADVVDRTEFFQQNFILIPQAIGDGVGVQAVCQW